MLKYPVKYKILLSLSVALVLVLSSLSVVKAAPSLSVGSTSLTGTDDLIYGHGGSATGNLLNLLNTAGSSFVVDNSGNLDLSGSVSSGGFTGTIVAGNVSSGDFGSNTGGGNYSFPAALSIGTDTPTASLNIKADGATSATDSLIITDSNDIEMFRVRDDGNIGIALGNTFTDPQKTLDISGDINLTSVSAPLATFTLTGTTGGSLDDGALYTYSVAYYTATGETEAAYKGASYRLSIDLEPGQTAVQITNIPVSTDPRVTRRKIYRTAGDDAENYTQYLVTTINNNTTTSYTDTIADESRNMNDSTYRKDNTTVKGVYVNGALFANMGEWNASYGYQAGDSITSGRENFTFGRGAGTAITTGSSNIAIGSSAMPSVDTGSSNVGIGYISLYMNQGGSSNIGIGVGSVRMAALGSVSGNTGVGVGTLYQLINANNYNTALGYFAGAYFQGSYNLFLGASTGQLPSTTAVGNYNTFIGYDVGDNATAGADNNILIGKQLDLQVAGGDNQLSIGNLIFATGLGATGTTISTGNVGIASSSPAYTLDVAGTAQFSQPVIVGTPTSDTHAATKSYVDNITSGGTPFTGDLNMGGNDISNVNKLTVNTIDPLYNINDAFYSSYAASMVGGVKEEYVGKATLAKYNKEAQAYEYTLNLSNLEEGTDLWLWKKVVDFSKNNVDVFMTPYGKFANTYYLVQKDKIIMRSNVMTEVSYRLVAKRFDWRLWPTKSLDQGQTGGLKIN